VNRRTLSRASLPAVAVMLTLGLAACGGNNEQEATGGTSGSAGASGAAVTGEVIADGSSTVGPLTEAAAELFKETTPGVNITVQTSGTGGGFEKFCQGQTDLSNASRPIKDEEKAICDSAGIAYTELRVATDALTVVASTENTFLTCLTTDELKKLWEPAAEGKITTWDQVNPSFPKEKIELFGPGTDSGTFDYFTDEINGEEGVSRTDYNASEDDNVIVQGVSGSANAIGYFGYTYFEENASTLKAIQVDSGSGCVTPSAETAQDGSYAPLARPLFVYVSNKAYTEKPAVKAFVDWYAANDQAATEAAQFVPLNDAQTAELTAAVAGIGG
jgi:phosphate transport system substrate-binding protein